MANSLVNRDIVNSSPRSIFLISGTVDTAEVGVTKIDISGLVGEPSRIRINWIKFSTNGLNVKLAFDRAVNPEACMLVGHGEIHEPIEDIGTGAGTGDLKLTTLDAAAAGNRGYTILIGVEAKV
jgi:hypothetical protein